MTLMCPTPLDSRPALTVQSGTWSAVAVISSRFVKDDSSLREPHAACGWVRVIMRQARRLLQRATLVLTFKAEIASAHKRLRECCSEACADVAAAAVERGDHYLVAEVSR